jgi:hypothetical protein
LVDQIYTHIIVGKILVPVDLNYIHFIRMADFGKCISFLKCPVLSAF